jgi:hypothetical protein
LKPASSWFFNACRLYGAAGRKILFFCSPASSVVSYDLKGRNHRWQGWGAMLDDKSNRFRIELIQNEDRVWRIVTIQSKPYEYSDAMADKLKAELWKTALTH